MSLSSVTAIAHPNLALVKYWGKRDAALNIPTNNSISINLGGLTTTTTVLFDSALVEDSVTLNGATARGTSHERVVQHLDRVRSLAGVGVRARVDSRNDFPASAGFASSASGFAALSLAATRAAGLDLDATALSRLARLGSGSACRSLHGGFVEWIAGDDDGSSQAEQLAPPEHWDLRVLSVVLSRDEKELSSAGGHEAAPRSPLFEARLQSLDTTLAQVRRAVRVRDLPALLMATEREAVNMHAIAMTSTVVDKPWWSGAFYWQPRTLQLIQAVQQWRGQGVQVGFTIDAGANVHLLCAAGDEDAVAQRLLELPHGASTEILVSAPGEGARILADS
ncbi:MAG: diphosphomevalonate decarboxylase [Pseudomonadota bacterium]